jgi:SOS-response transcriptional repressor LexA
MKGLREAAGLSSQADAATEMGVGLRTWSAWERGEREPPAAVIKLLRRMAREGPSARLVPVVGRIDAGPLTMREEDPLGYIEVTGRNPHDELRAFIVVGDSMAGAGILPDDVIVVRLQDTADHGDIVVVQVGGEGTVKRIRYRGGRLELVAAKEGMAPIQPAEGVRVIGKVIESRRQYEHR